MNKYLYKLLPIKLRQPKKVDKDDIKDIFSQLNNVDSPDKNSSDDFVMSEISDKINSLRVNCINGRDDFLAADRSAIFLVVDEISRSYTYLVCRYNELSRFDIDKEKDKLLKWIEKVNVKINEINSLTLEYKEEVENSKTCIIDLDDIVLSVSSFKSQINDFIFPLYSIFLHNVNTYNSSVSRLLRTGCLNRYEFIEYKVNVLNIRNSISVFRRMFKDIKDICNVGETALSQIDRMINIINSYKKKVDVYYKEYNKIQFQYNIFSATFVIINDNYKLKNMFGLVSRQNYINPVWINNNIVDPIEFGRVSLLYTDTIENYKTLFETQHDTCVLEYNACEHIYKRFQDYFSESRKLRDRLVFLIRSYADNYSLILSNDHQYIQDLNLLDACDVTVSNFDVANDPTADLQFCINTVNLLSVRNENYIDVLPRVVAYKAQYDLLKTSIGTLTTQKNRLQTMIGLDIVDVIYPVKNIDKIISVVLDLLSVSVNIDILGNDIQNISIDVDDPGDGNRKNVNNSITQKGVDFLLQCLCSPDFPVYSSLFLFYFVSRSIVPEAFSVSPLAFKLIYDAFNKIADNIENAEPLLIFSYISRLAKMREIIVIFIDRVAVCVEDVFINPDVIKNYKINILTCASLLGNSGVYVGSVANYIMFLNEYKNDYPLLVNKFILGQSTFNANYIKYTTFTDDDGGKISNIDMLFEIMNSTINLMGSINNFFNEAKLVLRSLAIDAYYYRKLDIYMSEIDRMELVDDGSFTGFFTSNRSEQLKGQRNERASLKVLNTYHELLTEWYEYMNKKINYKYNVGSTPYFLTSFKEIVENVPLASYTLPDINMVGSGDLIRSVADTLNSSTNEGADQWLKDIVAGNPITNIKFDLLKSLEYKARVEILTLFQRLALYYDIIAFLKNINNFVTVLRDSLPGRLNIVNSVEPNLKKIQDMLSTQSNILNLDIDVMQSYINDCRMNLIGMFNDKLYGSYTLNVVVKEGGKRGLAGLVIEYDKIPAKGAYSPLVDISLQSGISGYNKITDEPSGVNGLSSQLDDVSLSFSKLGQILKSSRERGNLPIGALSQSRLYGISDDIYANDDRPYKKMYTALGKINTNLNLLSGANVQLGNNKSIQLDSDVYEKKLNKEDRIKVDISPGEVLLDALFNIYRKQYPYNMVNRDLLRGNIYSVTRFTLPNVSSIGIKSVLGDVRYDTVRHKAPSWMVRSWNLGVSGMLENTRLKYIGVPSVIRKVYKMGCLAAGGFDVAFRPAFLEDPYGSAARMGIGGTFFNRDDIVLGSRIGLITMTLFGAFSQMQYYTTGFKNTYSAIFESSIDRNNDEVWGAAVALMIKIYMVLNSATAIGKFSNFRNILFATCLIGVITDMKYFYHHFANGIIILFEYLTGIADTFSAIKDKGFTGYFTSPRTSPGGFRTPSMFQSGLDFVAHATGVTTDQWGHVTASSIHSGLYNIHLDSTMGAKINGTIKDRLMQSRFPGNSTIPGIKFVFVDGDPIEDLPEGEDRELYKSRLDSNAKAELDSKNTIQYLNDQKIRSDAAKKMMTEEAIKALDIRDASMKSVENMKRDQLLAEQQIHINAYSNMGNNISGGILALSAQKFFGIGNNEDVTAKYHEALEKIKKINENYDKFIAFELPLERNAYHLELLNQIQLRIQTEYAEYFNRLELYEQQQQQQATANLIYDNSTTLYFNGLVKCKIDTDYANSSYAKFVNTVDVVSKKNSFLIHPNMYAQICDPFPGSDDVIRRRREFVKYALGNQASIFDIATVYPGVVHDVVIMAITTGHRVQFKYKNTETDEIMEMLIRNVGGVVNTITYDENGTERSNDSHADLDVADMRYSWDIVSGVDQFDWNQISLIGSKVFDDMEKGKYWLGNQAPWDKYSPIYAFDKMDLNTLKFDASGVEYDKNSDYIIKGLKYSTLVHIDNEFSKWITSLIPLVIPSLIGTFATFAVKKLTTNGESVDMLDG
jgi:hypothetical protein